MMTEGNANKKPKKTIQEIKETVQNVFLYFLIQVVGRTFLYLGLTMSLIWVIGFFPVPTAIYFILTFGSATVITEIIMQKPIYKYVYQANVKQLDKYWWVEIIKYAGIPLILLYIFNVILLSTIGITALTEVEFIYAGILIAGQGETFQSIKYTMAFLIFNSLRLVLCNYTCYRAYKTRINDTIKLKESKL